MKNICLCNNCENLLIDPTSLVGKKEFDVDSLGLSELALVDGFRVCPNCITDKHLSDDVYRKLWEILGDVPVNEDDEIETPFLHFEVGTDKYDIWHWFEETFDLCIEEDFNGRR